MKAQTDIIILAAGCSSRLGRPKQLVSYGDQTLLSYTIQEAKAANLGKIMVVLGAKANEIQEAVNGVQTIMNEGWASGMGSSIVQGVQHISQESEGFVLLLSDQPYVTADLIHEVAIAGLENGISVCDYGEGKGPPSYFSKEYFEELQQLTGDQGAKSLIKKYVKKVKYVSFPKGRYDIDTVEDLKLLRE